MIIDKHFFRNLSWFDVLRVCLVMLGVACLLWSIVISDYDEVFLLWISLFITGFVSLFLGLGFTLKKVVEVMKNVEED